MKQNNDFQWSIQIPTFLSHEKCDELVETIKTSEQGTTGCVGDMDEDGNHLENQIIPNVRKTHAPLSQSSPNKNLECTSVIYICLIP